MEPFIDSEMTFGPYPATSHGFRVDGSTPHEAAGEGVKMIDFFKLDLPIGKAPKLWLVEAKKSTPNLNSPNYSKAIKALEKRRDQAMSEEHKIAINSLIGLLRNLWATSHRRAPEAAICFVGTICANLRLD